MRKLLLIALVIAVLSLGLVGMAGAATSSTGNSGAMAGVQSIDTGSAPATVDVNDSFTTSLSSAHGLCDHGDSTDASASY